MASFWALAGSASDFALVYKQKWHFPGVFATCSSPTGIELFEGVCILATNRRRNLGKTLSRRISMQVEFPRPQTAAERLRIWQAIQPPKLPLDSDVDLELLAHEDLSCGEIKNVLLNAARFAAAREDAVAMLTFADFDQAVRWELRVRQERHKPIGFNHCPCN